MCRLEASLGNDDTFEANYHRLINAHYRRWLACGSVRYRRCAIKNLGHPTADCQPRDVNCSFRLSLSSLRNAICCLFLSRSLFYPSPSCVPCFPFVLCFFYSLYFPSFFCLLCPPPPFSVARPAAILRREIYSDMARKDAESSANRRLLRPCIARRSRYRYDK